MFAKHLRAQLRDIADRFLGCGRLVVCSDAPRATLWRRELFPEYKAHRKSSPTNISRLAVEFLDIVRERGDVLLEMPRMEADDLAYLVVRTVRHSLGSVRPIVVVTNDRDYIQLCAHFSGVRIFDATLRQVCPSTGDALRDFRMKLLTGDRSDNIIGVCSPAAACTMLDAGGADIWPPQGLTDKKHTRLEFNEVMMDMRRIPDRLVSAFDDELAPLVSAALEA